MVTVFITSQLYQGRQEIIATKKYVRSHWNDKFDLDSVAGAAGLSPSYFLRLFKRHTGDTPFNYYKAIKVGKLKELLCNENLSTAEALSACGLEYCGECARKFKDLTGMTPSEFRNTHKK